ncbi:Adenosylhomocysteinase [Paraburkholderia tropica]|nr:Adenosylhomocysteinase [Paraburkholderia tropica]
MLSHRSASPRGRSASTLQIRRAQTLASAEKRSRLSPASVQRTHAAAVTNPSRTLIAPSRSHPKLSRA